MQRLIFVLLVTIPIVALACKETRQIETKTASSEGSESAGASADKKYVVEVPEAAGSAEHQFSVKPTPGFKINLEYPWKVDFKSASHGELTKTTVTKNEGITLAESEARIDVPVKIDEGGSAEVEAVASFSICNENVCKNYRDEPIVLSFHAPESAPK